MCPRGGRPSLLALAADSVSDGIVAIDEQSVILFANPAMTRIVRLLLVGAPRPAADSPHSRVSQRAERRCFRSSSTGVCGFLGIPREDVSGSETILPVGKEEGVRRLVRMVLEGKRYTVLEASGWQAAHEIAGRQKTIHLVITGVVMPGVGGSELASRLEAARSGIRVLFMSGYTDGAVVNHGLLSSATAFLQKPFAPAVLLRKVREVIETTRS
jgi:FOG: CheY-like receiver